MSRPIMATRDDLTGRAFSPGPAQAGRSRHVVVDHDVPEGCLSPDHVFPADAPAARCGQRSAVHLGSVGSILGPSHDPYRRFRGKDLSGSPRAGRTSGSRHLLPRLVSSRWRSTNSSPRGRATEAHVAAQLSLLREQTTSWPRPRSRVRIEPAARLRSRDLLRRRDGVIVPSPVVPPIKGVDAGHGHRDDALPTELAATPADSSSRPSLLRRHSASANSFAQAMARHLPLSTSRPRRRRVRPTRRTGLTRRP